LLDDGCCASLFGVSDVSSTRVLSTSISDLRGAK
jgi:hypothetical protein